MTFKARVRRIWEDGSWDEGAVDIPGDPEWPEEVLDKIAELVLPIIHTQAQYRKTIELQYLGIRL